MRIRWTIACIAALLTPGAFAARTEVPSTPKAVLELPLKGERIEGVVVAWDEHVVWVKPKGADAERGIPWADVTPAQTYSLWTKLMDRSSPASWLYLGIAMLDVAEADRADRAFDQAVKINPKLARTVKAIRRIHNTGEDPRALVARATAPPPDKPPPAADGASPDTTKTSKPRPDAEKPKASAIKPWPDQTAEERAATVADLRAQAQQMVAESGVPRIVETETDYFLFYSNLSPSEIKKWSGVLDSMYRTLVSTLEIPKGTLLFHGKCVIFIFNARHEFLAFEKSAFNFDAARAGGVCHPRGPDTFVSFFRGSDDTRFQIVLVHETTHAFMHRYRSPAWLPTWANEGLADYVAGVLTPASNEPLEAWTHAKQFANQGKDAGRIMKQNYEDGSWFDDDSYPISHMLVRFLMKYKARAFKEWIDDIKSGIDWEQSMKDRFGVTPDDLARGFIAETLSEKRYTANP